MAEKLVDLPHIDIDNLPLIDQERYYETELMIAPDFHRQAAALTELGIIHVRTGQYKKARNELWSAMHVRSGLANLGTIAAVAAYFFDPRLDNSNVIEYLAAKKSRS